MFRIHPSRLRWRRKKCKTIVDEVLKLEWEMVSCCNICGSFRNVIIANIDRYGFPIRTALCQNCGVVYLLDRLTADSYSIFYKKWYRPLISQYKGYHHTPNKIRLSQAHYGSTIADVIQGYVNLPDAFNLLDIGGSTGGISAELIRRYGCKATVLDPAPDEISLSEKLGVDSIVGTLETYNTKAKYDFVLLCRTLDHLFDLKGSLVKIRGLMNSDGLFYCDFTDFLDVCRKEGAPEAVAKVDHCYCLTHEVAPNLLRSVGFDIVSVNMLVPEHVGFLMRPSEPSILQQQPIIFTWNLVRTLHEITADWQEFGRTSYNLIDWGRKKIYNVKKKVKAF